MTEAELRNRRVLSIIIWIGAGLILWELTAIFLECVVRDPMAERKVPGLASVALTFAEYWDVILRQAGVTFGFAAAGFAIGAAAGFVIAVIMRASGLIEKMILPYLLASQMIPILGLAPIVFGLLKDINAARIAIAAWITFFPISVNLLAGMKSVELNYLELMKISGSGRAALFRKLLLPWSLPYLFTGFKIAAPVAVSAAILVDTLSARNGIGYVIIYTLYGGGTVGQFWPALITAALMGVLSFTAISLAERAAMKRRTGESKRRKKPAAMQRKEET